MSKINSNAVPNSQMTPLEEIFNPFSRESYENKKLEPVEIPLVYTIPQHSFWGDHDIHETQTKNIYIYKIRAWTFGFRMEGAAGGNYFTPGKNGSHPAFLYFERHLRDLLDPVTEDGIVDAATLRRGRLPYYCFSAGKISQNKAAEDEALGDFIIVPREMFYNYRDSVFLAVCVRGGAPSLKGYELPREGMFFETLPTASAVFDDEKPGDSAILGGVVKRWKMSIPDVDPDNPLINTMNLTYTPVWEPGHFEWSDPENDFPIMSGMGSGSHRLAELPCAFVAEDGSRYACPDLKLDIYSRKMMSSGGAVTATVWRSGNNDDIVKPEYLPDDHYDRYSFIRNSVSLDTVYHTAADLRMITPGHAARYFAGILARMPKGERNISLEGGIEMLFGGAIYRIVMTLTSDNVKDNVDANPDMGDYYAHYVRSLFDINNSRLFLDSAVTYGITFEPAVSEALEDALFYMKYALAVPERSNGCERAKELVSGLFSALKKEGISVDHVTADMEKIYCDAKTLSTLRFNGFLQKLCYNGSYEELRKDVYGNHIWNEISERREECRKTGDKRKYDVLTELMARGFIFTGKTGEDNYYHLREIVSVSEEAKLTDKKKNGTWTNTAPYGVTLDRPYSHRRNLNVWDAVLKTYENKLLLTYLFQPIMDSHDKAECGSFARTAAKGYINRAQRFETYLGGTSGPGNELSSTVTLYGGVSSRGFVKRCMDNWRMYPNRPTILTMLIESVNVLRASRMSSGGKTVVYVGHPDYFLRKGVSEEPELSEDAERYFPGRVRNLALAYYREMVYHAFLNDPAKVYLYFNCTDKETDDTDPKSFYPRCYEELQDILVRMNGLLGSNRYKPVTCCMAPETDPYILSGAQTGSKRLWRISWNLCREDACEIRESDFQVTFSVGGKTITFPGGRLLSERTAASGLTCGAWIETGVSTLPRVTAVSNFYRENAACLMKDAFSHELPDGIRESDTLLRYWGFKSCSVFGEKPDRIAMALKFRVTRMGTASAVLLSELTAIRSDDLYRQIIPFLLVDSENRKACLEFRQRDTDTRRYDLELRKIYELRQIITVKAEEAGSEIRTYRYELRDAESGTELTKDSPEEYSREIPPEDVKTYMLSYAKVFHSGDSNAAELFDIRDYRVYLDKRFEKAEIFRERDGINAGRVNRSISDYEEVEREIGFDTTPQDKLVGKFSWLNTSVSPVLYRLVYTVDGRQHSFGTGNVFPQDGRAYPLVLRKLRPRKERPLPAHPLRELTAFQKYGLFMVKGGTEGHILLDLPKTSSGAGEVQLAVYKMTPREINKLLKDEEFTVLNILKWRSVTAASVRLQLDVGEA